MATTPSSWTIDPVHSGVECSPVLGGKGHPTITGP